MLYLLVSNSYHILDEEIKKIVKDEKYEVIDYLKTTLEDIVMEASYSDLFSNKKILIIKNATFFSTKIDTSSLDKYLLNINPNTILIFTCNNIDERLKIVKTFKQQISPKLRWLNFANRRIDKSSPEYIRLISGVDELKSSSDERKLEAMVREQLKEEFPNIENMKSYELLVDAVIYNYKKKQLQAMDEQE